MSKFTFDTNLFSDLHKDVYGFRPRGHWFYDASTTDEQRQEEWDYLCKRLDEQLEEEKVRKAETLKQFYARVEELKKSGALNDQQAIKWIVQSLNPDKTDLWYGGEWVCWKLELGFEHGHLFTQACKDLEKELEELDEQADRHYYAMSFEE